MALNGIALTDGKGGSILSFPMGLLAIFFFFQNYKHPYTLVNLLILEGVFKFVQNEQKPIFNPLRVDECVNEGIHVH